MDIDAFYKQEGTDYTKVKESLRLPVDQKEIKQREGGKGIILNYVTGKYVTDRLLEATNNEYQFEIISATVYQSEQKDAKGKGPDGRWSQLYNPDGSKKKEDQSPYVIVHGRLTIPGLGSREQFGSSELYGGVTEQAESFKGAATDALKKCASLFGIALELYEPLPGQNTEQPVDKSSYAEKAYARIPQQETVKTTTWPTGATEKLKKLKLSLSIDNDGLNPYVAEFSGNKGATFKDITPSNIVAFNIFLEKKIGG